MILLATTSSTILLLIHHPSIYVYIHPQFMIPSPSIHPPSIQDPYICLSVYPSIYFLPMIHSSIHPPSILCSFNLPILLHSWFFHSSSIHNPFTHKLSSQPVSIHNHSIIHPSIHPFMSLLSILHSFIILHPSVIYLPIIYLSIHPVFPIIPSTKHPCIHTYIHTFMILLSIYLASCQANREEMFLQENTSRLTMI